MAKPLKIHISGIEETLSKLKKSTDKIKNEIDAEMGASVELMATNAKRKLPAQYGPLRASISTRKLSNFRYLLSANKDYAPYIEFGTGDFAATYVPSLEKEWQKLAEQFIKNKQGTTPQTPYFYPSVTEGYKWLYAKIKSILERNERL
jgi:hypothetical protein